MTLEEAISREKEKAKKIYLIGMLCHANPDDGELDVYIESGREHEQIAEWLEDYKRLKSNEFFNFDSPVVNIDKKSYNKAIDDFANKIKECIYEKGFYCDRYLINEIAEKLKEGEEE